VAAFEAWLVFLILVVNVVGEIQRKKTLAASRGFLAAAGLSCYYTIAQVRCASSLNSGLAGKWSGEIPVLFIRAGNRILSRQSGCTAVTPGRLDSENCRCRL